MMAEPLHPLCLPSLIRDKAMANALAMFAGEALALGFRQESIDSMARAVAILEVVNDQGRADTTTELYSAAPFLEAQGLLREVIARAKTLKAVV